MTILYITPKINNEGGVARVLSVKTNYLISQWGYDIHIVTQNDGNSNPFFDFNPRIQKHDIALKGNSLSFLYLYKKQIEQTIRKVNPDIVILCDFGLKAFLFPYIIKTSKPVIFEAHASKFNEPFEYKNHFFNRLTHRLKYFIRNQGIRRFHTFVALSETALHEWKTINGCVIPNPIWSTSSSAASLNSKIVIAAGRYSYEKGFDRLLRVWSRTVQKHPDWVLEIYGKTPNNIGLEALAEKLHISDSVRFLPAVKNIEEKYLLAAVYTMTSRSEAFPMVLLEAMSYGLPVVAFDCPIGPKTLIRDKENGFLIEEGNTQAYAEQLSALMDSMELRIKIGAEATEIKILYSLESVMNQWHALFLQFRK